MKISEIASVAASLILILGVRNGYIALWNQQNPEQTRVFPYRAELLPVLDQQRLDDGIPITDTGRLHSLLEDYLS